MSDDDARLMERLAALEAEVKADADAKSAAKAAVTAKVKEQRAAQLAEQAALRERQAVLVSKRAPARTAPAAADDATDGDELGSALALARRAHGMKQELSRTPQAGEKSWIKAGIASMLLGPLGWLYAGSFREAIPASVAWVLFGALASGLPSLLLMPVLLVAMPLSGIAGAMYAVQYNRKGSRQRLFDKKKDQKALPKKT